MMDAVFGIFGSLGQVLMLLMGTIFFAVGALLVFYPVWQWLTWPRVRGRIVEVRAKTSPFADRDEKILPVPEEAAAEPVNFAAAFKKSPGSGVAALLVALLVVGIPLLFVGVGGYFAADYIYLKTRGVETTGQIVSFEERESDESGYTYAPVVRFRDHAGTAWTETYKMSSSSRMGLSSGQNIGVFYERARPQHFIIDRFWLNMILPIAFMGMGGLFLFILFFRGWRKLPEKDSEVRSGVKANIYYAVYEYITPDGRMMRAQGDGGSSALGDKIPGTEVSLFLRKDDFDRPSQLSFLMIFFGLIFAAPGVFVLALAWQQMDFTPYTLVVGVGFVAYLAFKVSRVIKPRAEGDACESFRARMKAKRQEKRAEGVLLTPQEFDRLIKQRDRSFLMWAPLYILIAVAMIAGGYYLFDRQGTFARDAVMAQGEVIRLISSHDSDGTTYYPEIAFTTQTGERIKFRDRVGSNPPSVGEGDVLQVLYNVHKPQEAMVDRGWLNHAPGFVFMAIGAFCLYSSVRAFSAAKTRLQR